MAKTTPSTSRRNFTYGVLVAGLAICAGYVVVSLRSPDAPVKAEAVEPDKYVPPAPVREISEDLIGISGRRAFDAARKSDLGGTELELTQPIFANIRSRQELLADGQGHEFAEALIEFEDPAVKTEDEQFCANKTGTSLEEPCQFRVFHEIAAGDDGRGEAVLVAAQESSLSRPECQSFAVCVAERRAGRRLPLPGGIDEFSFFEDVTAKTMNPGLKDAEQLAAWIDMYEKDVSAAYSQSLDRDAETYMRILHEDRALDWMRNLRDDLESED